MKKLKINFFGDGFVLHKLMYSKEEIAYIKNAINNNFLIEDILHHPEIALIDRVTKLKIRGLLNTYKNQIEIWYASKKLQKFRLNDLNDQFIAFPLYPTKMYYLEMKSLSSGIYLLEREIGLVNSFEGFTESFNIENLIFSITQVSLSISYIICDRICFNGKYLRSCKTDTLVIEQQYFIVD